MPSFKYVALDGAGHKQSGILEATSVGAARHELAGQLFDVSDALRGGSSFADAMANQGDIFPSYYIGILRSAELTGHLDIVLDQLSAYIARDAGVRRSIRSALAYPVVVMGMAVITVGI